MGKASRHKAERRGRYQHYKKPDGTTVVPLHPETRDALKDQRAAFVRKFGREPGPDDPVFFDENADTPQMVDLQKVTDEMAFGLVRAGVEPAMVYAFRKTGLIVTATNKKNLLPEDLAAWNAALDEYDAQAAKELQ